MTMSRTCLGLLGVVALLAGCSAAPGADVARGEGRGQKIADAATHEDADDLADDLEAVSWLERRIYLEAQVPVRSERHLYGGRTSWSLLASSQATRADGTAVFHLTVRIREHFVPGNTSDWDPPGEATVARCFEFVVVRDEDVEPEETDCPDGKPLRVDADIRIPQPPMVRARDVRAVRDFLRVGGLPIDVDRLAARLGRGLTPTVEQSGGVTAVAVSARPDGTDCVVGKRTTGGRIVVWVPDRMLTMPGEYGCIPRIAFDLAPGYIAGA